MFTGLNTISTSPIALPVFPDTHAYSADLRPFALLTLSLY